jgi:pilus assembly protein CpaE
MLQLSILLLATDRVAGEALAAALSKPGHGVTTVADPVDLFASAPGYGLVVVDQVPAPFTVAAVIEELRRDESTQAIPVLAVAQADDLEERIGLLEAGADDVITKPFDQAELEARVEALSLRFQRSKERSVVAVTAIGDPRGRRIVSVFSPKGGCGTTTIAVNLAMLAGERNPGGTLLIDLDLSFGQVSSHLNLQPKQSLLELARDEAALREPELFRTYALQHPSGINVLAAPPAPGFASLIDASRVELVLERALEAFDIVIVDAGTTMDERMFAISSRSDTVVIPVLPEIPALNAVRLLMEQLTDTGALGATTVFVLNNAFARDLLKRSDIENALGAQISADLPYDSIAYLKAVNEGNPVVRSAPKSAAASGMRNLSDIVLGPPQAVAPSTDGKAQADADAPKERRGLFGRRR